MEDEEKVQGFKYNGKHSSELNVQYIPDASARGDFHVDFEVLDMDKAWFPGGEYYQTRVKSKVISLDCYYERVTIETRENIIKWLDRRTSGELIFDDRPYAIYHVYPTKKIEFKDYRQNDMDQELYSGTFTITFTAYHPFADLNLDTVDTFGIDIKNRLKAETGYAPNTLMPISIDPSSVDFCVYNPGTEIGHSVIRFAGSVGSSDFTIYNATTGDKFTLKAGLTTIEGEYLEIDSKTGRVERVYGDIRTIDFMYHENGYITFAPHKEKPISVRVDITSGSDIVKPAMSSGKLTKLRTGLKGMHLCVVNALGVPVKAILIKESFSDRIVLSAASPETTSGSMPVVDANHLTITKAADANITRLEVMCKAEVR